MPATSSAGAAAVVAEPAAAEPAPVPVDDTAHQAVKLMTRVLRGGATPSCTDDPDVGFIFAPVDGYRVFADGNFVAIDDSTPRRELKTMPELEAEMHHAEGQFAVFQARSAIPPSLTADWLVSPRGRERGVVSDARAASAEAQTAIRTRLQSAAAAPSAAPAPAPAPLSPGLTALRREMAGVKGQPHLMAALEKIVKAAEKQKRRREASGGAQQPGGGASKPNLNMVFFGPPGTGKTSSVEKLAKALADPAVGVLSRADVTVLNKHTELTKGSTVPVAVGKMFEKAKDGILFLDEVHKRTDSKGFVDALVPLLSEYEGRVMVVIAGYKAEVVKWLSTSDPGMSRRFPEANRLEFLPLPWDALFEIGENTLKERSFTLSGDAVARKAFKDVMRYVADKDPPENGGGANNAVDSMIQTHDARDDDADDDDDCCITAADIIAACPQAAEAAAARSHAAPAAATPAAAPASTAGGARCSSAAGSHASSSAAAAGLAHTSDSEEDKPLGSKRLRTAAAPTPAPSGSSRKRKVTGLSPEAECVVQAIDARYGPGEAASPIAAWGLLSELHQKRLFQSSPTVCEKMEQGKLGKFTKGWITEAIGHIKARGGESAKVLCEETVQNHKLMVYGLCRKR